jgi:hypothetical protein
MINAGTRNQDILCDCENALTSNPSPSSASDPRIVENSCLIELHTTIMDLASERHLVWMEVVEARCPNDLIGTITQYIDDGFRSKLDVRIRGKV